MDASLRTDRLSLVIPAFNEAATIERALSEAEAALANRFASFEVLVVDDGSRDETASLVERLLARARHTRLIQHLANRGYGAALRTGFEAARYDLVAFTDADCQFDLAELGKLASLAAEHPIVAGYRADRKDPWRRRFLSWGYNRLARMLLGTRVRDVDCALKVFHRAALAELLPESRGFFVNTEMMARARQLRLAVAKVPVTHRQRAGGTSKVSLREVPRTAATLLRFWWSQVVAGPRTAPVIPAVFHGRLTIPNAARVRVRGPAPSTSPAHPAAPRERLRESA
jgi:glycosyltransferase involved in cell wall biosynthesis